MKLLALDTSSEGCSAALWLDGRVTERFEVGDWSISSSGETALLFLFGVRSGPNLGLVFPLFSSLVK